MSKLVTFYDRYHLKNHRFSKVISQNNFTYFYILKFLQRACIEPIRGKKVLDLGSGVGTMSLYLAEQGAQVTGVDISERAVEIAQTAATDLGLQNVTFVHGDVMTKRKGEYDLVISFEVIEHLPDDYLFLKQVAQNLTASGRLILSTPSHENWLYRLGFYQKFDREVGHLRRYSKTSLRTVVEKSGFEILHLTEVEGPLRNILFTTKLVFLIKCIKGPLVPVFHWADWLSGKIFGFADIQVVAKKI